MAKDLIEDLIELSWSEKSGFRYTNSGVARVLIGLKISVLGGVDLLSAWSGAFVLSSVLWGFDRQATAELAVVGTSI